MRKVRFIALAGVAVIASNDARAQSFLQSQGGIGGIVGNLLNNIRPQQQPSYQPQPQYQPRPQYPPSYAQPQQYAPSQPVYPQDQRRTPTRPAQYAPPQQQPPATRQRAVDPTGDDTFTTPPATTRANPRAAAGRNSRIPNPTPIESLAADSDDPFANQAPPPNTPSPAAHAVVELQPVTTPPPNKTVHVIGHGATTSEARTDAIRQALQQTMQQLIVVDRAISNDDVTRNNILSTMNGYIEAFNETHSFVENRQYAVEADITVSASRMVNFIGITKGGSASVSGQSIAANRDSIAANRKVKGELFDRLFRGYPADDLDIAIKKVSLPENDIDHLYIDFAIRFSPAFINSLKSGLAAIAEHRTRNAYGREKTFAPTINPQCGLKTCSPETTEGTQAVLFDTYEALQNNLRPGTERGVNQSARFCIYGQTADCYELPLGEYGTSFIFPKAPNLAYGLTTLVIRFLDKNGQPTGTDGADSLCSVVPAINVTFVPPYYPEIRLNSTGQVRPPSVAYDLLPLKLDLKGPSVLESYLFDSTRIVRAIVPIASINLDKTDRIAAYATQTFTDRSARGKSGVLLDLFHGPVDQGTACDKLDQSAQLTMPK